MSQVHAFGSSLAFFLLTPFGFGQTDLNGTGAPGDFQGVAGLGRHSILPLHAAETDGLVTMGLEFEGQTYVVDLEPHSLRHADFTLFVADGSAPPRAVADPSFTTFRGRIHDGQGRPIEGAGVAGNRTPLGWELMLDLPHVEDFVLVQPVDSFGAERHAPGMHVVYRASDMTVAGGCGTDTTGLGPYDPGKLGDLGARVERANEGDSVFRLSIESDVEFWQLNGSDVAATLADIEAVLNGVDFVFERDVQISLELTVVVVRTGGTSSDPYGTTSAGGRLSEFQEEWNLNVHAVKRDLSHMLTGVDLDGNIHGAAVMVGFQYGVACLPANAYSVAESRFSPAFGARVAVSAHQIGHNFGSRHCDENLQGECCQDCHIMCTVQGGCNGVGTPNFGAKSIGQMKRYVRNTTCSEPQLILDLPFTETVPTDELDEDLWVYNDQVQVKGSSKNKPSEPFTLRFNVQGDGTSPGVADELRSHPIDLSGETSVTLTYFTEYRRCEGGESLICEYLPANSLGWVHLNTVVATSTNQKFYDMHSLALPAGALHDSFQFRFRLEADNSNDMFFLDDVSVTASGGLTLGRRGLEPGVPTALDVHGAAEGETVVFLLSLAGPGTGPVLLGELPLDLAPPIRVLGNALTGSDLRASLELLVPLEFDPLEVHVQAVVLEREPLRKSNVSSLPINR